MSSSVAYHGGVPVGAGGAILAYQLTLSHPGGADYALHITTGTPGFQTFLRPWMVCLWCFGASIGEDQMSIRGTPLLCMVSNFGQIRARE